ncbi:MAG TPA: hypothetical protein PKJ83_09245 [Cyclobacteriaceae bacterium]|nr:hypothetical protein [Cyclobacteriaceae bacterium]
MNLLKKVISQRLATLGLLTLFSLVIVFHILVLVQVIPYKIVWGGRLENDMQMIQFEGISIALNLIMLALVAIYSGYLKWEINRRWIQLGMWIMVALFLLNTVGNLFAINDWERWIFTPITFLLAVFSFRLAIDK